MVLETTGNDNRPSSTTSEVSKHIHTDSPDHTIKLENTKILVVEHKWLEGGVKEAIHIRALIPSLNRDRGRNNLLKRITTLHNRHCAQLTLFCIIQDLKCTHSQLGTWHQQKELAGGLRLVNVLECGKSIHTCGSCDQG